MVQIDSLSHKNFFSVTIISPSGTNKYNLIKKSQNTHKWKKGAYGDYYFKTYPPTLNA